MRRRESAAIASVAASPWIPLDNNVNPWAVSAEVTISGGASLTYSVEVTYDDLFDSSVTPVAFPAPAALTTQTANAAAALPNPVTGVRLNVTIRASGSAVLTVIQQGLQ